LRRSIPQQCPRGGALLHLTTIMSQAELAKSFEPAAIEAK